jgi:predicted SAM-dependent methyltransferase
MTAQAGNPPITPDEIESRFANRRMDDAASTYLHCHSKRYARLTALVKELAQTFLETRIRIADIGPSFFTELLFQQFPHAEVVAVGYRHEESRGGHLPEAVDLHRIEFHHFDLNDSRLQEQWITVSPCHIVILAEVIEHLHIAPTSMLEFLKTMLADRGYLIVQTPNAASLVKRISLLSGRNPYEMIRENNENPGHFHEYTKRELLDLARACGFEVHLFEYENYFNRMNTAERAYGFVQSFAPRSCRDGITLVLRKPK